MAATKKKSKGRAPAERQRYTAEQRDLVLADVPTMGVNAAAKKHGVPQSNVAPTSDALPTKPAPASPTSCSSTDASSPTPTTCSSRSNRPVPRATPPRYARSASTSTPILDRWYRGLDSHPPSSVLRAMSVVTERQLRARTRDDCAIAMVRRVALGKVGPVLECRALELLGVHSRQRGARRVRLLRARLGAGTPPLIPALHAWARARLAVALRWG